MSDTWPFHYRTQPYYRAKRADIPNPGSAVSLLCTGFRFNPVDRRPNYERSALRENDIHMLNQVQQTLDAAVEYLRPRYGLTPPEKDSVLAELVIAQAPLRTFLAWTELPATTTTNHKGERMKPPCNYSRDDPGRPLPPKAGTPESDWQFCPLCKQMYYERLDNKVYDDGLKPCAKHTGVAVIEEDWPVNLRNPTRRFTCCGQLDNSWGCVPSLHVREGGTTQR